ncbi:molybdenum cofactor guanylyltransferase [Halomarina halobia]|uniref:Probable molybdenum cofactor guanylyltransferase n=1 Tax=Halomarina halobia TaxID=3033386 RepID=A0ABD6AAG0_9EURY|nr:molybdenum cofactor guanylyltransferase [Halomarina sp. PSR21]
MSTAVVVAGGRSTRFGEADKAVADLAGTPMIRRVADRLAGVVDALVVNCREEQVSAVRAALDGYPLDTAFAVDDDPDEGPMAGIRTGLRAVEDEYAFVVACDMPFVEPDVVRYLFERATGRDGGEAGADGETRTRSYDAAVPRLDDEWFQTTHAVYRAAAMADACDAALERGERRVVAPLFELDYVVVDEPAIRARGSLDTFENVNTREEFAAAEERLA